MDGYLVAGSVTLSLMLSLWIFSLIAKDASIVDRFWGAGFVFIAWALAMVHPAAMSVDQTLLLIIVSIWGLRLSIYIHLRNKGHGEDYRYKEMRSYHGGRFWWYSLISVFLLQGGLMLIVSMPVIYVMSQDQDRTTGLSLFAMVGFVVWLVGFVFEAGGDLQLSRFKADPTNKGKLLTTGLWSLTRHPNYFGDACQWWGFGLFAFSNGLLGLLLFVGPIVMTLFIRKVSGVDLLEKSLKTQKPGYEEYVSRTPPFVPRLPRFWGVIIFGICGLAMAPDRVTASEISNPVKLTTVPVVDLPFAAIHFKVFDKKSGKEISWGEETIDSKGDQLVKVTEYYPPGAEKKVIQRESSSVNMKDLYVEEYQLSNFMSGETATIKNKEGSLLVGYQEKSTDPVKEIKYIWSKATIIGKTLHHFIVRNWNDIIAGNPSKFDLLVPMKQESFGFRTRLVRTYDKATSKVHVISLEPQNWAIRTLVPQMDFHYTVQNGLPRLDYYEGATTIAIDGDDDRIVTIDFKYVEKSGA
jgi:steroid 5-alpha reductase family enzyme